MKKNQAQLNMTPSQTTFTTEAPRTGGNQMSTAKIMSGIVPRRMKGTRRPFGLRLLSLQNATTGFDTASTSEDSSRATPTATPAPRKIIPVSTLSGGGE